MILLQCGARAMPSSSKASSDPIVIQAAMGRGSQIEGSGFGVSVIRKQYSSWRSTLGSSYLFKRYIPQ